MVVVQLQVAGSSQQDYIQKVTAAAFFQTLYSLLSKPTVVFYNKTVVWYCTSLNDFIVGEGLVVHKPTY